MRRDYLVRRLLPLLLQACGDHEAAAQTPPSARRRRRGEGSPLTHEGAHSLVRRLLQSKPRHAH